MTDKTNKHTALEGAVGIASLRRAAKNHLLRGLFQVVNGDRANTADMLAYIGEIDRRQLYLEEAYPSMFMMCTKGFGMSESIAGKRIRAGRAARRFPRILDMIRSGKLHLRSTHTSRQRKPPNEVESFRRTYVERCTRETAAGARLLMTQAGAAIRAGGSSFITLCPTAGTGRTLWRISSFAVGLTISTKRSWSSARRSWRSGGTRPRLSQMGVSRRDFGRSVLAGLAATTVAGTSACGSSGETSGTGGSGGGSGGRGGAGGGGGTGGANACVLYAEQTEGPYYLDLDTLRRDITEEKPGAALRLLVSVQDEGCAPVKDVAVDVWHCDAAGVYSGFPGQLGGLDTSGLQFLRGTQVTDDSGVAAFDTIYPGWYPGRTTHIHFKVHVSSTTEATSQIYFPEDLTAAIYQTAPYDERGQKDTPNAGDGIAVANPTPLADVTGDAASGYTATIVVTVA